METSEKIIGLLQGQISRNMRVLEPSAGEGKLADRLVSVGGIVDCIELNSSNVKKLVDNGKFQNIWHGDFLKLKCKEEYYDAIVAVPPYKDNIDCLHIRKMYDVVRAGGLVSSMTLPLWTTGIFEVQREFRNWLYTKNWRMLFIEDESYALCPKALLVIRK